VTYSRTVKGLTGELGKAVKGSGERKRRSSPFETASTRLASKAAWLAARDAVNLKGL